MSEYREKVQAIYGNINGYKKKTLEHIKQMSNVDFSSEKLKIFLNNNTVYIVFSRDRLFWVENMQI